MGKWILILDNVDDDELLRKHSAVGTKDEIYMLNDPPTQPPLRHLFKSSNGTTIVTTRNRGVALDIASHKNIIEVQPINQNEALDLLRKKLGTLTEHDRMAQLAQGLEFMPLAIVQAASYITHRSPRCSVSQYLLKIQRSDREAVRMLSEEAGLLHRDWEAKNSIMLTWQISFDHIRGKRPPAADLLSLMSFFNCQGIAEDILRVQQNKKRRRRFSLEQLGDSSSGQDTENVSECDADDDFEKDITILCVTSSGSNKLSRARWCHFHVSEYVSTTILSKYHDGAFVKSQITVADRSYSSRSRITAAKNIPMVLRKLTILVK